MGDDGKFQCAICKCHYGFSKSFRVPRLDPTVICQYCVEDELNGELDFWRCEECHFWNDPDDTVCDRCESPKSK